MTFSPEGSTVTWIGAREQTASPSRAPQQRAGQNLLGSRPHEHDDNPRALEASVRPCVLVVDDNAVLRPTLAKLLSLAGYLTMTAANGEEALARLNERLPCVILLDMEMPVMNGYEFRERQRHDPRFAEIPVLCMTGEIAFDEVTQRTGVKCLSKPVEWDDILAEVQEICGRWS